MRRVLAAVVCLGSASLLHAAEAHWVEKIHGDPYSVRSRDGVIVAVYLQVSSVVDLDVIVFNDTAKKFKIVPSKIRPIAVRKENGKVRWRALKRNERNFPVPQTTSSATRPVEGSGPSITSGQPYSTVVPRDLNATGEAAAPLPGPITGRLPAGEKGVVAVRSYGSPPAVPVKPGGHGRTSLIFVRQPADWFGVTVTIAGKDYEFDFAAPRESAPQ